MLQALSEQIRACHERAVEARRKAETALDPERRAEFLEMEKRWLALARSYAFAERVEDFTAAISSRRRKPRIRGRVAAFQSTVETDGIRDEVPELNHALRLQEISTLLIQEGNVDALYDQLLDAVISLMSADMGSVQTFYPERNELRLLTWRGFHPGSAAFWEWVRLDSASTCGLALSAGARVVGPDVESCDCMVGTADLDA